MVSYTKKRTAVFNEVGKKTPSNNSGQKYSEISIQTEYKLWIIKYVFPLCFDCNCSYIKCGDTDMSWNNNPACWTLL